MLDSEELVVGANGSINIAPFGTALPDDIDASLDAAFIEMGFATPDGVKFTDAKTVQGIPAWQSFYDIRKIVTARDAMAAFTLEQWNDDTVALAFGGGEVVTTDTGFRYNPPSPETIDERSAVIQWQDGDKEYALVIEKCMVTQNVETNVMRTDIAKLPITIGIIGTEDTEPWYLLWNDAAEGGS